ncbi:MAG: ABC transporter permease [Angelakisella sp.]|nr:ABC transporter permease [Angelakisella sp.]
MKMLTDILSIIFTEAFAFSIFRITTPILFAALAAVVADRAGVTNIGLEGIMMISALTGVIFSAWTESAWLGLLCAILLGVATALMIGFFALKLKTDIILAGIAVNMLGNGGTIFFMYLASGDRGYSANLASKVMPTVNIPGLQSIPILGGIFSGHNILTYFAFLAVFLVWVLLYKTPMGLQIRAVGESPNAADSVGVSVNRIKYIALAISGGLAGLGGAFMSMGYMSSFNTNMTAGRGFIALAAEAMGRGEPIGTMLTSLLFGFADALANNMQSLGLPQELVALTPYVFTIVGLALYAASTLKKNRKKLE